MTPGRIFARYLPSLAFAILVSRWTQSSGRRLYSFSEILPAGKRFGFTTKALRAEYLKYKGRGA